MKLVREKLKDVHDPYCLCSFVANILLLHIFPDFNGSEAMATTNNIFWIGLTKKQYFGIRLSIVVIANLLLLILLPLYLLFIHYQVWHIVASYIAINVPLLTFLGFSWKPVCCKLTPIEVNQNANVGDDLIAKIEWTNYAGEVTFLYQIEESSFEDVINLDNNQTVFELTPTLDVSGNGSSELTIDKQNNGLIQFPFRIDSIPCEHCRIKGFFVVRITAVLDKTKSRKTVSCEIPFEVALVS